VCSAACDSEVLKMSNEIIFFILFENGDQEMNFKRFFFENSREGVPGYCQKCKRDQTVEASWKFECLNV